MITSHYGWYSVVINKLWSCLQFLRFIGKTTYQIGNDSEILVKGAKSSGLVSRLRWQKQNMKYVRWKFWWYGNIAQVFSHCTFYLSSIILSIIIRCFPCHWARSTRTSRKVSFLEWSMSTYFQHSRGTGPRFCPLWRRPGACLCILRWHNHWPWCCTGRWNSEIMLNCFIMTCVAKGYGFYD